MSTESVHVSSAPLAHPVPGSGRDTDGHGSSQPPLQRVAGVAGIVFFVVFLLVIVVSPDVGNPGDSAALLRADFLRHTTSAQVFTWIEGAQAVLLLLFVTGLRDRLSRAGQPLLGMLGMAGAVGVLALTAVQHACVAAMGYLVQSGHADDSQLTVLNTLSYATETVLRFPMALMVGSLSLAILRSKGLPRWIGYVGLVEAVVCLVAAGTTSTTGVFMVNGPVAVPSLLLLLVWTLAGGIALLRTRE